MDGYLEIKSKINKNDQNNNDEKNNKSPSNNVDNIFITCNLIEDCYVNKKMFNSIYRKFKPTGGSTGKAISLSFYSARVPW